MLSIGALSRAVDIPVATLRTWERRYGYPVAERKPSGHRVYPLSVVPRLRRVAEALQRGSRAAEALTASEAELASLLRTVPPPSGAAPSPGSGPATEEAAGNDDLLHAVASLDRATLTQVLTADWARLGPVEFLERRIAPLLREVGDAWADGRLDVAAEHFVSESVGDLLRSLRLPFDERASGPLVLLATLPDEQHALGLQMAALVLAVSGCRVCNLGANVPVEQIATHAAQLGARAVAISLSSTLAESRASTLLARLRSRLPPETDLVVGGEGAPDSRAGVLTIPDLRALHAWGIGVARQGN